MNKSELIETIAAEVGLSKALAGGALDTVLNTITSELANGGTVALTGFGTFSTAVRSAREGRNPQSGETIQIAEATLPKFKAGKGLKDAVNG